MAKFSYSSKKQVKIKKPKKPKFSYTSKSQVKIRKPRRKESLGEIARSILFEKATKELRVLNPLTKNRIKVTTALEYPKDHPAYKAAIALLKKKKVTLPANIHKVKPGETIPMFDLRPFEDPDRARTVNLDSALSGDGAIKHLRETQSEYVDNLPSGARDGLDTYTGAGYRWINAYLRGDIEGAYDAMREAYAENYDEDEYSEEDIEGIMESDLGLSIEQMTTAFEGNGCILQQHMMVYRGIDSAAGIYEEIKDGGVGTIIQDSGFVSTSFDEKIAMQFGPAVVLKIVAKKGTKALYPMAGGIGVPSEKELILNRDTRMRVLSIKKEQTVNNWDSEIERDVIFVETLLDGEKE